MEIKTCEEYVLAKLKELENDNALLVDETNDLSHHLEVANEEIANIRAELNTFVKFLRTHFKKTASSEGLTMDYIWKGDQDYEFAVKYLVEQVEDKNGK